MSRQSSYKGKKIRKIWEEEIFKIKGWRLGIQEVKQNIWI